MENNDEMDSVPTYIQYKNVLRLDDEQVCPVCHQTAPHGEVHHPHYGGICCYSCRAFFRRAHQNDKKLEYFCLNGGNCNLETKKCKKCRLQRCYAIGMSPKWVLNENQKRVRFRHYFKKKDEEKNLLQQTPQAESSETISQAQQLIHWNPLHQIGMRLLALISNGSEPQVSMNREEPTTFNMAEASSLPGHHFLAEFQRGESQSNNERTYLNLFEASSNLFQQQIRMNREAKVKLIRTSDLLESFTLTFGKLNLKESKLVDDLIRNHQGDRKFDKSDFVKLVTSFVPLVAEFANSHPQFSSLAKEDQRILLVNNAPMYLQYILARYFTSKTGFEQLSWILEGTLPPLSLLDIGNLDLISLDRFNADVGLCNDADDLQTFSRCCQKVNDIFPLPQYWNGVLASIFLFRTTPSINNLLKEKEKIQVIFRESLKLLDNMNGHDFPNIRLSTLVPYVIATLQEMKSIFDKFQFDSSHLDSRPIVNANFSIGFTLTEESWLQHKFWLLQVQFSSVEPPWSLVQDGINVALKDLPASEAFVPTWVGMTLERARRVSKMHPEFLELPIETQNQLLSRNQLSVVALTCARVQILKSGREQMKNLFGFIGTSRTKWENRLENIVDLDELKVVCFPALNCGKLTVEELQTFTQDMKDLIDLVQDESLYQIFLLISILENDEMIEEPAIAKARLSYLRLFQRKAMSEGKYFMDYSWFKKTSNKIKNIANYLMAFMSS